MEQTRLGYQPIFDCSPITAFCAAVEALHPGATGSQIAALLDHKAKRTTVLQWRAGRWSPPRWALDLLASKLTARATELATIASMARHARERPGLKAGARNLAIYLANKNR